MQLILVRGIPGSGKSTLAEQIAADLRGVHYEADMYFLNDKKEYVFDPRDIKHAHKWCQDITRSALNDPDITVVVSNTFTTKWELKPYFDIAKEYGIVPIVYLAQNQFQNVHNVPQEVLCKMRARFEYDISSLFE